MIIPLQHYSFYAWFCIKHNLHACVVLIAPCRCVSSLEAEQDCRPQLCNTATGIQF